MELCISDPEFATASMASLLLLLHFSRSYFFFAVICLSTLFIAISFLSYFIFTWSQTTDVPVSVNLAVISCPLTPLQENSSISAIRKKCNMQAVWFFAVRYLSSHWKLWTSHLYVQKNPVQFILVHTYLPQCLFLVCGSRMRDTVPLPVSLGVSFQGHNLEAILKCYVENPFCLTFSWVYFPQDITKALVDLLHWESNLIGIFFTELSLRT